MEIDSQKFDSQNFSPMFKFASPNCVHFSSPNVYVCFLFYNINLKPSLKNVWQACNADE